MKILTYEQNAISQELKDFLKKHEWICPDCGGRGEYEGEYGPIGCNPCNSRLLFYICPHTGKRRNLDWGDSVVITDNDIALIVRKPNKLTDGMHYWVLWRDTKELDIVRFKDKDELFVIGDDRTYYIEDALFIEAIEKPVLGVQI